MTPPTRTGAGGGGGGGGGGGAATSPPTIPPVTPPASPPSTPPTTPRFTTGCSRPVSGLISFGRFDRSRVDVGFRHRRLRNFWCGRRRRWRRRWRRRRRRSGDEGHHGRRRGQSVHRHQRNDDHRGNRDRMNQDRKRNRIPLPGSDPDGRVDYIAEHFTWHGFLPGVVALLKRGPLQRPACWRSADQGRRL